MTANTNKTFVPDSSYPNDDELVSLLVGDDVHYKWGGGLGTTTTLTYSFASQNTFELNREYEDSLNWYYPEFFQSGLDASIFEDPLYSFRTFNDLNKTSIRESLDTWSDATGINFIEITETSDGETYGDLRFFLQDFNNWASLDPFYEGVAGYAYLPSYDSFDDVLEGDVFLDTYYINLDSYSSHLISHEIGHALGLDHPFEGANIVDLKNYESVMSYDQNNILANDPMPIDIKAMEFLYGVNFNANPEGNDYYFSSRPAEDSYNVANNKDYNLIQLT